MLGSGKFYKVLGSFVTSVTFWMPHTRHSTVSAPHWGRRVRLPMVIVVLRVLPLAELYVYSWLSKTFPEFCNSSRSQFNLRDGVRKCKCPFLKNPKLLSSYCFPLQSLLSYLPGLKPGFIFVSFLLFLFKKLPESVPFSQGLGFETQKLGRGSFKNLLFSVSPLP